MTDYVAGVILVRPNAKKQETITILRESCQ
jgi:hypothetical protein